MRSGFLWGFLFILFLSLRCAVNSMGDGDDDLMPVVELGKVKTKVMANGFRRQLNSFQVCSTCMCCGRSGTTAKFCLPSPCCYAINCNIPNRPFGFCSFTPKTCNCFQCHI